MVTQLVSVGHTQDSNHGGAQIARKIKNYICRQFRARGTVLAMKQKHDLTGSAARETMEDGENMRNIPFILFRWRKKRQKSVRRANKGVGAEKVLTQAEERSLLRALAPGDRELVRFLLTTGCRISEALGIRQEKVQYVDGHYAITVLGKGSKRRVVYYGKMPPDFSALGTRVAITNRIRRASRKAIGRTISAHCCRHTWATRMIKEGKSLTAVSRYLGHANTSITADLYVHDDLKWEDVK